MVCQLLKEGLVCDALCQRVRYFLWHWFEWHSLLTGSIVGSTNVQVCVLMKLLLGMVIRVGPGIGVLHRGGCISSGRGSFGGLKPSFGVSSPD